MSTALDRPTSGHGSLHSLKSANGQRHIAISAMTDYYIPAPNRLGALSDDAVWRLSVTYIRPKSRTERPRKTKIGIEVAHVTRDSDITVKGQGHQAALLTAVLTRQAAAAVGVRTCWPWETAATLPSARLWKALWRPRGEETGGGIPWRPHAYSLLEMAPVIRHRLFITRTTSTRS